MTRYDALGGNGELGQIAAALAFAQRPRQRVVAFALHLGAQQRIELRGRHQSLVQTGGVVVHRGAQHGGAALHNHGYVLVVGKHVVHAALERIDAHYALHQPIVRPLGRGAITREYVQHGGVGHQQEHQQKQEQTERRDSSDESRGRYADVPILLAAYGIGETEPLRAEQIVYFTFQIFHGTRI